MNTRLQTLLFSSIASCALPALVACSDSASSDTGTAADAAVARDTGPSGNDATGGTDTGPRDTGAGDTGVTGAVFVAMLNGTQETPSVSTAATGSGTFVLSGNTLSYRVTHTVAGGTAAHIHEGAVGVMGGIIFPFTPFSSDMQGTLTLTAAQVATLRAGGYYANVHSGRYPGGEIRGQILPQ